MTRLNNNTQKAQSFIDAYDRATETTVYEVYRNPSTHKYNAELDIKMRMINQNGRGYRILSHNSQTFTCGYLVTDYEDKVWLIVDTAYNTYIMQYA